MYQTTVQILFNLREKAIAQNNQPFIAALEKLIALIESNELPEERIPAKQMLSEIDQFERGRTSKDDLLAAMLFYMEGYGAAINDVGLSRSIEVLLDQLAEVFARQKFELNIDSVDFTEIQDADTFELFARDFLEAIGYEVSLWPGRGPDGGKDIIIQENLEGVLDSRTTSWLVSCKHFAKSNTAVGKGHEDDIRDRVEDAGCDGFLGFYSTMTTSPFNSHLNGFPNRGIEVLVMDKERIAHYLIFDPRLVKVVAQYFPIMYQRKRKLDIEREYELRMVAYKHEHTERTQEAARRNDAIALLAARRAFERNVAYTANIRNVELAGLGGEYQEESSSSD